MFIASSVAAFLSETRRAYFAVDGEIIEITPAGARFIVGGAEVEREPEEIQWDQEVAEKGGFETFMLKEIYEQPEAIARTIDRPRPKLCALSRCGPAPSNRSNTDSSWPSGMPGPESATVTAASLP